MERARGGAIVATSEELGSLIMHTKPSRALSKPLAYASVGKTGDFGNKGSDDDVATTWTFACGVGWLYGLGLCIGPFFGTGVGFTIPGGVLAGAGGGVGVVVGIGMGGGIVWGSGRGDIRGLGVIPPMTPPFSEKGLPRPADLPSPQQLARRAADYIEDTRERVLRDRARKRLLRRRQEALSKASAAGFVHHQRLPRLSLADPRWK